VISKKVAPKLSADSGSNLEFAGHAKFPKKEAFVVVIATSNGAVQMTFHHPIGSTKLGEEEWVATESSQVHYLFKRAENPGKKSTEVARQKWQQARAVESKLLEVAENEVYFFGQQALGSRRELTKKARSAAKDDGKTSPESYVSYLPDNIRELETNLLAQLRNKEVIAECERLNPLPPHETVGGLHENQPQQPVDYLKGMSIDEARNTVINRVLGTTKP
jgi:vacuolar-type H+-ATPase subunit H